MKICIVTLPLALAALYGCKPMPNEGVPFYLRIDSVLLVTAGDSQGVSSHLISDVWVEANATNLGAYELPAYFPVLEENEVRMVISAGVKQSGQAGVRVVYPFYDTDTFTLQAERTKVYNRVPVFRYKPLARFAFRCEDFTLVNDYTSAMNTTSFFDSAAQAPYPPCGVISVSPTDSNVLASQVFTYSFPTGSEVWLELDHKNNVPFWVGYYAKGNGTVVTNRVLFVNPRNTWNKLYVKLSESINSMNVQGYKEFNLFFEALKPAHNTAGGHVYLDNIKIVYY
ncbi:MAG: hypothetical protein NZM35_06080 [Chitinophagales bacterium]|nr:hypothetical protein [Chitinophagales bacterium]MDW8417975.1 hypothetical protein [Chitinophagales bacterium]